MERSGMKQSARLLQSACCLTTTAKIGQIASLAALVRNDSLGLANCSALKKIEGNRFILHICEHNLSDNVVAQCLKIIHLKIAVFNNEKPKFSFYYLPSKSLLFNKLWTKKRTQLLPIGKHDLR